MSEFSGAGWEASRARRLYRAVGTRPVAVFLLLSVLFGPLVVMLNPPLRGPDELAHYLRVYGLAQGELIARTEHNGQLGLYLPAGLHREVATFEAYRKRALDQGFSYRDVLRNDSRGGPPQRGAGCAARLHAV